MGERTAEEVLREQWAAYAAEATREDDPASPTLAAARAYFDPPPYAETVAPFTTGWPGLAPAPAVPPPDADEVAARVLAEQWAADAADDGDDDFEDEEDEEDLGGEVIDLAPRGHLLDRPHRAADVPALLDAHGLTDHLRAHLPFGLPDLVTVLRSWEQRFGTRVIGLAHDRVTLSVAAPPRTPAEAEHVAAEHFAFSSDTIVQDDAETLSAHAADQVLNSEVWSFWWD